jgi:hypothetical protein
MSAVDKPVRQSVSLPQGIARRVKSLAKSSRTSANRMLVELIESGLEARDKERNRFLELADRLTRTGDPEAQRRLKEELARMTCAVDALHSLCRSFTRKKRIGLARWQLVYCLKELRLGDDAWPI